MRLQRATIDFETRSACSIRNCGSWRYSLDPTTDPLCLAFRLPYWEKGRTGLWHPAFPHLGLEEAQFGSFDDLLELFLWVQDGNYVEAHNAWFERGIWYNIMQARWQWPEIAPDRWLCSAAKAAAHSLPRNLEDAVDACHLPIKKDDIGDKLIKRLCVPRKSRKADRVAWARTHAPCQVCEGVGRMPKFKKNGEPSIKGQKCPECAGSGFDPTVAVPSMPLLWNESRDEYELFFEYCRQDVLAEEGLSDHLGDLNHVEQEVYLVDQMVNERGYHLDAEAIDAAFDLIDTESVDLNKELHVLTEGTVEKATQRERMMEWFETQGLELLDTTKETVEETLARTDITPTARRGLELMKVLGRSSTAKYVKMRDWLCPDGRAHGGLLYHGASTGRWSGQGVQPHNFVKGRIPDMELAWAVLKTLDRNRIITEVVDKKGKPIGGVMDVLAEALRGAITATPGKVLYVADYAAIEARVVLWLAEDYEALKVFLDKSTDIYCVMASTIFGRKIVKADPERQLGKAAILGLGFQMGASKFVDSAATYGITLKQDHWCAECGEGTTLHWKHDRDHLFQYRDTDDPNETTAAAVVKAYREKFWRVKEMWADQERAAIEATVYGDEVRCGRVVWFTDNGFLYCRLPSGRCLGYPEPQVKASLTSWGQQKDQLSFMGIDQYSRQWQRQVTYGGSLVENMTQAVARDLMAEACVRAESSGKYAPVLTVHDELIAEGDPGHDIKEFEHLMAFVPPWAEGCPVDAEGWSGFRYRK